MMRRQHGAALVVAMWLVTLGSVLAFNFALATRAETRVTGTTVSHHQARAAAEAGIWQSIYEIIVPDPDTPIATDSSPVEFEYGNAIVQVSIQDALGLADLNRANAFTLIELIDYALGDPERAAVVVERIVDWRDEDDSAGLNGAEADDYRAAGYAYGPKNGPFNTREELRLIMGLSRGEYEKIAPFVTVFSGKRSVTERVAPAYVRDALDGDRTTRTPSAPDRVANNPVASRGTFEIRAEAIINGAVSRIAATVNINPRARGRSPVTMLAWRESWPIDVPLEESDELTVTN